MNVPVTNAVIDGAPTVTLRPRRRAADPRPGDAEAAGLGLAELVLGEPLEPLSQASAAESGTTGGPGVPRRAER